MQAARLLLALTLLVGCANTSVGRPSPAGLTTIVVRGNARNVVLIDPQGRVSRSDSRKGETPIPKCTRWDGGTETTLDDSSESESDEPSDVVTQIELSAPVVGRYRLFAEVGEEGKTSCTVTPVAASRANEACPELKRDAPAASGSYLWTIEFLASSDSTLCPLRVSQATRRPAKK